MKLLKSEPHAMTREAAVELVEELMGDPQEDWSYRVAPATGRPGFYRVVAYDADGFQAGVL